MLLLCEMIFGAQSSGAEKPMSHRFVDSLWSGLEWVARAAYYA